MHMYTLEWYFTISFYYLFVASGLYILFEKIFEIFI